MHHLKTKKELMEYTFDGQVGISFRSSMQAMPRYSQKSFVLFLRIPWAMQEDTHVHLSEPLINYNLFCCIRFLSFSWGFNA